MRSTSLLLVAAVLLLGCGGPSGPSGQSLVEARKGFHAKPVPQNGPRDPVEEPPPEVFRLVKYDSPVGQLAAYLTPDPADGQKHPAIVWITGGDCNSIGEVWDPAPVQNDQSAAQYRQAGIVVMFPSLRGGNDNPGQKEGYLGEVDDVLAAADYLAKVPYVDPQRIYLGGHSTGGTLVLLVSECSGRFRAVFSFGPADKVSNYGPEYLPFDTSDARGIELRSPVYWLASVQSPTFVIEGTGGNYRSLLDLKKSSTNPNVHFIPASGWDHFSILAFANELIAQKILRDTGPTSNLKLAESEFPDAAK